jgi:hypothetical protein
MTRTTKKKRNAGLLVAAAAAYMFAAWTVAPGFYDGFNPPSPYAFECPPSVAGAQSAPASGHIVIDAANGTNEDAVAFTGDGQVVLDLPSGSFVTSKPSVTVDLQPLNPCPQPQGLTFVTNTYAITADAPLVKPVTIVMVYSNLEPDPSYLYRAPGPGGPWTNIGSSAQAQVWTINTKTDQLGYFAAGYPAGSISSGSSQILPITIAILIVAVLVGGIPLTILRRRQAARGDVDEEEDG